MSCSSGNCHTITLSEDGTVYAFGYNGMGQLGLGHNEIHCLIPTQIPNLPQIKTVSCGGFFTVCLDYDGFIWSFGSNFHGQLGIQNFKIFNTPQKITNLPPVQSVSCGTNFSLFLSINDELYSCGSNEHGQLCTGDQRNRSKFKQTSYSNILKISTGDLFSLFQNEKGEIFGCGKCDSGQLGLNHYSKVRQIEPCIIPSLPPEIMSFCCGHSHSLFLTEEGIVYSAGKNISAVIQPISKIPPIQAISCSGSSNYLLDFEGNVWSFGNNEHGQLGHGDKILRSVPCKIPSLKNIKQISYSFSGDHFLAKDSQNKIFAMGRNKDGQLGTQNTTPVSYPEELNSEYFPIWGDRKSRLKSARK